MSEHTKEPWRYEITEDSNGWANILADDREQEIATVWSQSQTVDATATARRIVACVNACAGMTTQDLETNGFRNSVGNILRDKLDAERQRDELLAVLKDLRDNVKDDSPDMWGRVEAAIAKAEAS